jgi:protein-tyrosine-phosphatase
MQGGDTHKEEKKLVERLQQAGIDVTTLHPDQLDNSTVDSANVAVLTMDAGNIAQAIDMANTANEAVARNPKIRFLFGINGYADDSREIDQISEAKRSLQALFGTLTQAAFWRFDLEHQALMLVAIGAGHRTGTGLHVPPWMVKDPSQ